MEKLEKMQDKLYAHDQFSILIVLQAMDAAGKDSTIKHVMSGLNPQGVSVTSFKVPTSAELNHDFFWRHYKALLPRGQIGIFNRSHYENVLVTRIHPELILHENLPEINKVADIKQSFWEMRYKQINRLKKPGGEWNDRVEIFPAPVKRRTKEKIPGTHRRPHEKLEIFLCRHERTIELGRIPEGLRRNDQ